jgi:hypothetical protein
MEVDTIHGHRLIGNGFHVEHRSFNVARKGGVVPSPFRTLLGRITRWAQRKDRLPYTKIDSLEGVSDSIRVIYDCLAIMRPL